MTAHESMALLVFDKAALALQEILCAVEAADRIIPSKDSERTSELCALDYLIRRIREHRNVAQDALEELYNLASCKEEAVCPLVSR